MSRVTSDLREQLVALRRDLHQHPELAHQETRTAAIVAEWLGALDLRVRTHVGSTGVVATLRGDLPGPTVLLRADMDALPLDEADHGQPYRSRVNGAHHACGHDGHVAILLVVASILAGQRAALPGTVVFLFQPAEETVGGAEGMIQDSALDDPRPDACFALHLWNDLSLGTVDARPGPVFAAADGFFATITGPGGHGALPHQTHDPIVAAAEIVLALQTVVSRSTPPLQPAALTVGLLHAGTAWNVIPSRLELGGTLRTFDDGLRSRLMARVEKLVVGIADLHGLEARVEWATGCPPCVNQADLTSLVQRVAQGVSSIDRVAADVQTTGADDMALILRAVPGCYFLVGSANAERGLDGAHHSPVFDFDERALAIGVDLLVDVTLAYLSAPPRRTAD
ncbi:MAG: amidohydrolase [Chloroflexi bacterium]|nr:amidohydrolase [Chloroflexota bacterium]